MLRNLAIFSLATGFAIISGCVVVSDDDDTTSNDSVNATSGTPNTSGNDDAPATSNGDDTPADDGDDGDETAAATDTAAESSGGVVSNCGWGDVNEKEITEGYICDGDGVDPAGTHPIECPDVKLVAGAECGEILGQGCCDGDTVWFCQNGQNGQSDALASEDCS